MERDASRFYQLAARRTTDPAGCRLLGDLAAAEMGHLASVSEVEKKRLSPMLAHRRARALAGALCCR